MRNSLKCVVTMSLLANAVMAQQVEAGKTSLDSKGPIKVFILAGQSNMEGHGVVSMDGERDYNGGKGNLVNDLRKEFKVPNMPVVVGELGNGGPVAKGDMYEFRKAQEEGTRQIKHALFIKTTDFARPPEMSPNVSHGHHWCGNAESYFLIGEAAGEGMTRMLKK